MKIGNKEIGAGKSVFIIAEIGINHNGDINIAKKLIDIAAETDVDAVKFQKRTIDVVYTKEELDKPRESPWGTTNREQKNGLEFNEEEYWEIDRHCSKKNIMWFASCWDKGSVDFIEKYNPPCYKIASPLLTNDELLKYTRDKGRPIIISTGMSTVEEINHALDIIGQKNTIVMHCTSTYPSTLDILNLNVIKTFKSYLKCPVGYSGHSAGIIPPVMAVTLGACAIEKHITLDRSMYGSDQSASIEPAGLRRMVSYIRKCAETLGDGNKKVYDSEIAIRKKLRRI